MSSAFADSLSPRRLSPVRERRVAIVMLEDSGHEGIRSLFPLAGRQWPWTVLVLGVEQLVAEQPDAVVLVADFTLSTGIAALRRIRSQVATAHVVVVARDDQNAAAARQALNAGADAFVPDGEAD